MREMLPRAIVLAGGKSSRFGSDKACADVGGLTLTELCVSNLLELFDEVTVVAKDAHLFPMRQEGRVRVIGDCSATYAAILGLRAGLRLADRQINYITGCDMPLVVPGLIRRLYRLAWGRDCAVRCDERESAQPLGGFYSRTCLPSIDAMIASEDYRLRHLVQLSNSARLPHREVLALDPDMRSFCNINTVADAKMLPSSGRCGPATRNLEECAAPISVLSP